MQKETTRVILEPIVRSTPGAEGVVDLYLMPAYDDIANLYYCEGEWKLHYVFPGGVNASTVEQTESPKLTNESFRHVLEEMIKTCKE